MITSVKLIWNIMMTVNFKYFDNLGNLSYITVKTSTYFLFLYIIHCSCIADYIRDINMTKWNLKYVVLGVFIFFII